MVTWKDNLRILKLESIQQSTPRAFAASGGHTMAIRPYKDNSANELTRSIIDLLNFIGDAATRISSTGMMRKIDGKMKWTHGNVRLGVADIHAVFLGRHLSIEVKIGRDQMSEEQRREKRLIEGAGGLYFVAKDMPAFIDWLNQFFPANQYYKRFSMGDIITK